MARAIKPGQFVMIRPGPEGATDPLLGRPLALYDVVRDSAGTPTAFDVVYLVVGRGTAALAQRRPGERLVGLGAARQRLWPAPAGPVIFVAGGIGQTPFLALGRWWLGQARYGDATDPATRATVHGQVELPAWIRPSAITLLYGVRTAALLAGVDDFRRAGIEVELATDDGTAGHHGFVTDLLARTAGARRSPRQGRRLRAAGHAGRPGEDRRSARRPLRRLTGKPHGVRLRCLLQLRRPDSPGRRLDRPPPRLRRRTGRLRRSSSTGRGWFIESAIGDSRCHDGTRRAYRRARFWAWIWSRSRAACS